MKRTPLLLLRLLTDFQNKRYDFKWAVFVATVLVTMSMGCTTNKHQGFEGVLATADSLATVMHDSDSAVKLLEQVGDSMLKQDETTRMAYKLLCIKAYDRARLPYEGEIEIFDILNYYEKNGNKELLPVALYYAGRHCAKIFDTPSAFKYYHKAHELIGSDSSNYMNWKISRQIGQLYSQQMLYEESRKHYRDALRYSMISKDTVGAIWNIRDIGGSFQMVGDAVTCDTFLHNALQLAEAKHDTKMVREIQLCLSDNNIEMGRYDSAIIYLSPVLENKLKNDESPIYTNASRIYYHQGKLDSALYYIGKVLDVGNVYGKKTAYRNRTRIDLIRGDLASAKSDFENFVLYIDSIDHIRASEALANASAAYDYSMKEQENTRLREENQQRAFWGWVMALACALLLTVLFLAITFYKKRRAEDAARSMALEMALDKLSLKTSEHVAAKQGEISQLIDKIRDMKTATDSERLAMQNEIDTLKKQIALLSSASMRDASLPREVVEQQERFRSFSQEGRTPEDGDWMMLETALKEAFPRLFEVLSKGLHLSMMEERVCWLTKLGLKPSQTARLVGRSAQAITSIRSRLYRKIFCEEGSPEDFDRFIHDL